jgi:hypothetical protein
MDLASVFVTFQRFLAGSIQTLHAEERFTSQSFCFRENSGSNGPGSMQAYG